MRRQADQNEARGPVRHAERGVLPQPTAQFRRRAWLEFQRALDPLAPPKPLKIHRG